MRQWYRYSAFALAVVMIAALCGCATAAKKAGRAAATTTVQGATTGTRATVRGVQAVGGAAVDAMRPRNP